MDKPAWFTKQIKNLWGDRIQVAWERYKNRDFVIPVSGVGFYRRKHSRGVAYSYTSTDPKLAGKWFEPQCHIPKARFVVRENARNFPKIFDCVDDKGELLPLNQYVLDALASRHDAWESVMTQIEEAEATTEIEGPDGKPMRLNKTQLEARKRFADESHDTFTELAEGLGGVEKVYLNDTQRAEGHPAYTVIDRRRKYDASPVGDNSRTP